MKNNIKFPLLTLTLGLLSLSSCENEDTTGYSNLIVNDITGSVTPSSTNLIFDTTINVSEGDEDTFEYTVTLSDVQPVDIHVKISQVDGDAILGEDVEAEELVIPAYSLSGTGTIKVLTDCAIEADETITIKIGGETVANAEIAEKLVKLNIQNNNSTVLDFYFNFNQNIVYGNPATETSLCNLGYDIDFYVFDGDLNDMGIYDAATGNCQEHLPLETADLADGTYYIYYDLYDSVDIETFFNGTENFAIPITVDYSKCGSLNESQFLQESAFHIQSSQATGSDYVLTIEIMNGVVTLKNSGDDIIAAGRFSQSKKLKIKSEIEKARRNKARN